MASTDKEDVKIRQFHPDDLDVVTRIFDEGIYIGIDALYHAALGEYVKTNVAGDLGNISAVYLNAGGNFWVATVQDKVVGMVGIEAKRGGKGEVRRLAVDAAFHRRGIGRMLIQKLEAWAKENGFLRLTLSTGAVRYQAQKFYESLGYVATRQYVLFEDPYYPELEFEKTLD